MKKVFLIVAVAAIALTSCNTVTHTSATEDINTAIFNRSTADLVVAEKLITYKFVPDAAHRRAGEKAVVRAAVAKALEESGNAATLVAPQYEIKKHRGLFSSKIEYVVVKGYPAFYKNVHAVTPAEAEVISTLNEGKRKH